MIGLEIWDTWLDQSCTKPIGWTSRKMVILPLSRYVFFCFCFPVGQLGVFHNTVTNWFLGVCRSLVSHDSRILSRIFTESFSQTHPFTRHEPEQNSSMSILDQLSWEQGWQGDCIFRQCVCTWGEFWFLVGKQKDFKNLIWFDLLTRRGRNRRTPKSWASLLFTVGRQKVNDCESFRDSSMIPNSTPSSSPRSVTHLSTCLKLLAWFKYRPTLVLGDKKLSDWVGFWGQNEEMTRVSTHSFIRSFPRIRRRCSIHPSGKDSWLTKATRSKSSLNSTVFIACLTSFSRPRTSSCRCSSRCWTRVMPQQRRRIIIWGWMGVSIWSGLRVLSQVRVGRRCRGSWHHWSIWVEGRISVIGNRTRVSSEFLNVFYILCYTNVINQGFNSF